MCHGAAMARKTAVPARRWSLRRRWSWLCDGEIEEDEADGEDEADEALGEDVERHDGGEGEAGEERGFLWLFGRERIAVVIAHLIRDETAAKMGHRILWRGFAVLLWFGDAVEGDEEEVDGERHPESDEDVGDVEAGVEVGADAGGEGESGVEAGAVGVSGGRDGAEEADAERVDGEQKSEDAEREGKAGGPVVDAEDDAWSRRPSSTSGAACRRSGCR